MSLVGKAIVVTGASSGIGRECAVVASRLGARVVLIGRDSERLQRSLEALNGDGHSVHKMDLTQVGAIPDELKKLAADYGPFDGLVHSAGVHMLTPVRTFSEKSLSELLCVNVEAGAMLLRGFRQRGVRAERASVVMLASVLGLVGQPGAALYSMTKGAIVALCRSTALELAPEQIRVNCVAPGIVNTPITESIKSRVSDEQFRNIEAMHPLGLGEPADVAYSVAFLLSDAARWMTGSTLVVDGGYTAQ